MKRKAYAADDSYLDQEEKHINADVLMCDVLKQLGYKAGIEVFENAEKWYSQEQKGKEDS